MAFPTIMGTEHEYGIFVPEESEGFDPWRLSQQLVTDAAAFVQSSGRHSGALTLEAMAAEYHVSLAYLERLYRDIRDMDEVLRIIGGSGNMLANGARFYVDASHPEYSTPECADAYELLLAEKAGERIVEGARARVEAATGRRIDIHKDNSDRKGSSYSAHENYLTSPRLFQELTIPCGRFTPWSSYAAAWVQFLVTRPIWAGAGKVGSDIGGDAAFQLSQRAEFMRTTWSPDTTANRAIINVRDRAYADTKQFRRLHVIMGDANRCDVAIFLKMGVTALFLKMLEDDFIFECETFLTAPLNDPVEACQHVSYKGIHANVALKGAGDRSSLAIQQEVLRVLEAYALRRYAPNAIESDVLRWFRFVVERLESEPDSLYGVVDHITKRMFISRQLAQHRASWRDPLALDLDFFYHSTDPGAVFEHLYQGGDVVRLADEEAIRDAIHHPPETTRAWVRGTLIQRFPSSYGMWSYLNIFDGVHRFGSLDLDDPTAGRDSAFGVVVETSQTAGELMERWEALVR